jgi:hypothetical protein
MTNPLFLSNSVYRFLSDFSNKKEKKNDIGNLAESCNSIVSMISVLLLTFILPQQRLEVERRILNGALEIFWPRGSKERKKVVGEEGWMFGG